MYSCNWNTYCSRVNSNWRKTVVLSIVVALFYIPTSSIWVFPFSTLHIIFFFINYGHLGIFEVLSNCGFDFPYDKYWVFFHVFIGHLCTILKSYISRSFIYFYTNFTGYFSFTVITKYWLSSPHCIMPSCVYLTPHSLYLPLLHSHISSYHLPTGNCWFIFCESALKKTSLFCFIF